MNSKYQKYYDGLKGKDFSSAVNKVTTGISNVKSKVDGIESTLASDGWSEKGLEIVKSNIVPSLKSSESQIEAAISTLGSVISKVESLKSKLDSLKSECDALNSAKDDDEKSRHRNKISSLEKEIDSIISDINGTSLEFSDDASGFATNIAALKEMTSIAGLKAEFLGDVNDASQYYIDPAYAHKAKELVMFDNETGQILKEGDTLYLKPGETRILTVKLPNNAGMIDKVVRTTADGNGTFRAGTVITAKSDINPDPNVVDYVNYKPWSRHIPAGVDLHTNHYDWIITATGTGTATASQTCEYESTDGHTPKAMVDIKVVVG